MKFLLLTAVSFLVFTALVPIYDLANRRDDTDAFCGDLFDEGCLIRVDGVIAVSIWFGELEIGLRPASPRSSDDPPSIRGTVRPVRCSWFDALQWGGCP